MVRPPCCEKLNGRRGHWTEDEDAKILAYVSKHGTGNWTNVPKKAGLRRCGKSCRLRWSNYLRPDLRQESFTPQEEEMIIRLHSAIGSRWSIIAQQLPGRTDNDVKNHWNTKLRKKLSEMGIDPVTHKPFSQILADYGNIGGGLPNSRTRIRSLNRDMRNSFILNQEQSTLIPQEGFLHFTSSSSYASNSSMDLLSQLQAITLVTEASNSSSSSSSSPSSVATQLDSSMSFSWRDFLLEDPFLPVDEQKQENVVMQDEVFMQSDGKQEEKQDFRGVEEMGKNLPMDRFEASSPTDSSFVEAMLDRQNDMVFEFPPGLLEDSFFY